MLQRPDEESQNAAHLCVYCVVVMDVILHNHRFTFLFFFPFAYLFALAHFFHTQICILCMHKCGCFCVSHNSTTAGQRVQPCCSLSCHSVRWYTHLIHFALTPNSSTHSLCHAVSLQPDLCFKYGRFFCVAIQTEAFNPRTGMGLLAAEQH